MKNQKLKLCEVGSKRHLPSDLVPEILCRLPVKSLVRFRSVSKSWLALVDDDTEFARLHLKMFKNNSNETHLFLNETGFVNGVLTWSVRCSDTLETISLSKMPFSFQESGFIVSSFDGVVLIKQSNDGGRRSYKLWNPSLRISIDVEPIPPVVHDWENIHFGFGYDPLAKDYKIVTIICKYVSEDDDVQYSVGIYTVGIGSWKIIPLPDWCDYSYTEGVCVQEKLYVLATEEHNFITWDLLSFDLSNEVFSHVCRFDGVCSRSVKFIDWEKLDLCDGRFYVPMFDSKSREKSVWVLGRETLNWTKYCSCTSENIQVLYVKKNGDLLTLRRHFSGINGDQKWLMRDELAWYSPEKDEYKILREKRSPIMLPYLRVSAYVESLVLHQCNMNRKKGV